MARLDAPARPGWFARLGGWILERRDGRRVESMDVLEHNGWILGALMAFGACFEQSKHVPIAAVALV